MQCKKQRPEDVFHNNELRRKTLVVRKKVGLCKV